MAVTVREVGAWYFVLTSLLFALAVYGSLRRRLVGFGLLVLTIGAGLNLAWEAALFTVWGRAYESPLPTPVHAAFQGLTEFGPLFLIVLLVADAFGWLVLDPWRDATVHPWVRPASWAVLGMAGAVFAMAFWAEISAPGTLASPVRVYRFVDASFLLTEAVIALGALGLAIGLRNRPAVALFAVVGGLNVLVEVGGLWLGFRSYQGFSGLASVVVGLGEGGAASALTWIMATRFAPRRDGS